MSTNWAEVSLASFASRRTLTVTGCHLYFQTATEHSSSDPSRAAERLTSAFVFAASGQNRPWLCLLQAGF